MILWRLKSIHKICLRRS